LIPREQRHPVWLYIDEFQQVVRLPMSLPDMFAQARAMGLGITVAHQYLDQLSTKLRKAVLGTTRTHVTFQLGHDDAKAMAARFAPLTPAYLSGLANYEIAAKPCIGGATVSPVTGITQPLPEATTDGTGLARYARANYGLPRDQVEDAIITRATPPRTQQRIGEKPL
ncbi:MAG: TraM recognition domain-containing protein, partial [Mycobacteriales bacterium]